MPAIMKLSKRRKVSVVTSSGSERSLIFACVVSLGIQGNAAEAENLPQAGNCTILDSRSLASVLSLAWDQEGAVVSRRSMEEPARPVGLREHSGGFKLSLFYQDPITGPSEVVVFSMDLGQGMEYRIGTVSYNVIDNGTRVLSSMSRFEDAACDVR